MKTPCKFEPPEKHDDPFVSTAKFRETANLGENSGFIQQELADRKALGRINSFAARNTTWQQKTVK